MKTYSYLFGILAILLMATGCGKDDEPDVKIDPPVFNLQKSSAVEAVDLGLSVLWSNCNMGASSPTDYGGYFAWGDPTGALWSADGIGYNDNGYYENRGRVGLDINYAETYQRYKFSYRSRLMATFRDESVGDYRVNPKLYWRNRFQVAYQMPNSRFEYTLSTELHWLLNDPKASVIDNIRTVFTVDYRLSRHQYLEFSARMDNDIQVKKPVDRFYLGFTYHLKY